MKFDFVILILLLFLIVVCGCVNRGPSGFIVLPSDSNVAVADSNLINKLDKNGDTMTGTFVVTDFNSNESDGASAVAYNFDTQNNIVTSGAKLLNIAIQGASKFFITETGTIRAGIGNCSNNMLLGVVGQPAGTGICYDETNWRFMRNGDTLLIANPSVMQFRGGGDSAIEYLLNTYISLVGGGKRIVLRSQGILYNASSKNSIATNDHTFIGDGNFTGNLYADAFIGDGSGLTGISATDTNWQTSYNVFDANLALSYYKQADANNVFVKLADVNLANKLDKNGDNLTGDFIVNNSISFGDGVNKTNFDSNGHLSLDLNARVKEELVIDTFGTQKGASAPTSILRPVGSSGNLKNSMLSFSNIVQQDVYFLLHPPESIDNDVNVEFHVMWAPNGGWTSGNFVWKLEYLVKAENASEGDANISSGVPIIIYADVTPANNEDMIETEFIDTIDLNSQQILIGHFYRDVAVDNGNAGGGVMFFEIEYVKNKMGAKINE